MAAKVVLPPLTSPRDEVTPAETAAPDAADPPKKAAKEELQQVVRTLLAEVEDREGCLAACATLESATLEAAHATGESLRRDAQALTSAMRQHPSDAEVQTTACRAIQHLAASTLAGAAVQLGDAGACNAIRAAMDALPSDALVQQAACHALELLAFGGEGPRSQAVADGAVEAGVRALKGHRNNGHTLQAATAALHAMIEDGPESVQRLTKAGGIAAIVSALSDCRDEQQLQYWGRLLL
eukprot:CAMPEP_0180716542 /NCGR_PEP_ID=MMETSP1038_2-20121128/13509_1 /TAXON_ID=632150 /ORGANISM="Azadinium spinosum, Strain 3D9" /LENGTH=239 /DNA_ID=CAMNT_0022748977 /DNA_START=66 /DNA_END=783 /DNA_ORIENTATION=+